MSYDMSWFEMSGENDKHEVNCVYNEDHEYGWTISDDKDLVALINIRLFDDGTRICEVVDEFVKVYNEEGDVVDSYNESLPNKLLQDFLRKAEDEDVR